ncbi:MAG: hypothetical protein E7222_12845 [Clostridiales bacterium]|nr:hypothetical protein [Clostridiales bacterium]
MLLDFFEGDKKKKFYNIKKPVPVSNLNPISSMDLIEIDKISENGIFLSCGNVYSETLLIDDINYSLMTYKEQVSFLGAWCRILNSFSVVVQLHVFNKNRNMDEFRKEVLFKMKDDGHNEDREAFNDIIEGKVINGKQGIAQVKLLTISVQKNDYEDAKNSLANAEASLKREFSSIGSKLTLLNGTERLRLIHDFWRPGEENQFNFDVKSFMDSGFSDWKNEVCPSFVDLVSDPERVYTDKGIYTAFGIEPRNYPNSLGDTFYNELTNISSCSIFTITFSAIPKDCVIKTLEDKLMNVEGKIEKQQQSRNARKQFSSDISLKVRREKKELETMLNNVHENDQEMFWVDFSMVLFSKTEKKMEHEIEAVKNIMDQRSLQMKFYSKWQRQAINSALPLGLRQTNDSRTMFTQTAAIFIPFNVMQVKHSRQPFYYGICQIDKNPIFASRKYDLINGNGFVFGVPGSGKSFTGAKMEMSNVFLNTDDHIIIIDPTLEYTDVCDAYDGTAIVFSTNTKTHINPLETVLSSLTVTDENGIIRDKIDFMTGLCQQNMEGEFRAAHKSIIGRVTKRVFMRVAQKPVHERKQVLLGDIYAELLAQEEEQAKELALALEVFVDGVLDIFNHETNIHIDNRLISFGIRDVGESLYATAMMVMLEFITNRILENFNNSIATWLYVDEFHQLCNKEYEMLYLVTLWAKVRKLGGLCTGVTQNIIRVMEKEITQTLVCNSEYTLFLKQGLPDIDVILKYFPNISSAFVKYLDGAERGTGIAKFGSTLIPFDNSIEKDSPIYDIFNTNFHEKVEMKRLKEEKDEDVEIA